MFTIKFLLKKNKNIYIDSMSFCDNNKINNNYYQYFSVICFQKPITSLMQKNKVYMMKKLFKHLPIVALSTTALAATLGLSGCNNATALEKADWKR